MSVGSNIQESILKAIDTMAQRRIDQLQLDKTITAIINAPVGVKNGRKIYKVEYEGGYFNATAQNKDDAYLPRMAVYVQVPQGDFSKEKFILGQASKLATDEQISVVSATNNSFSIIGKNVIDNKAEKMGVYSYHSPTEEENSNTLNHRFNFLYKEDQGENQVIPDENLNLYKRDATAIMVRAEFMTKLTNEQKKKATGEYGLVFDLVFNNLAAGLGETQGEVFKYFREKVKVDRIIDGETKELSLDIIDTKLVEALEEKTYIELTETDRCLDEILSDIQELDRVYKNNNQTEYTFAVQDLISKYTILVQDIKRIEDGEKFRQEMKERHQSWMDEIIGQPAEKHVSYYLSSNDMIGNPFSFSSWISQYNIFEIDLDNFIRIDSILLYKQGFIEDAVKEATWLDEPDILVRDIQVYAMRPLSDNNSGYQLKVEGKDTGFVFENKESDVDIIANATLLREYFEDLTRNSDTTFYWFKQSENVVSPMQSEYSIYGGIGWSEIDNQHSTKLKITKEDASAYENHFRCAAVYIGEEVPIVLRYDFIVYNYAGRRFILQSDLGTDFTFDAGIPTITVYEVITEEINDKKVKRLEELHNDNHQYKFKWAIIDGNNQKVFLDTKLEPKLTDIKTVSSFNDYSNTSKLLKDIKWYCGDIEVTNTETNRVYATKIKYPMSNIASSANVTFECYISYRKEDEEDFSTFGKIELTLNNFKILNANSYRIWIENGDQVFQYDEYGNAPNVDKYKDPIEVLPLKTHLFAPNNIEVQNSSFRTKWYFPTEESLIVYNSEEAEIDPETNNKNMFRGSEIGFNIEKMYNYNFTNNQIRCQIDFNNQTLYADTSFVFTKVGNNGTNGTDMVAKIVSREWRNILSIQPFTLYVDKKNNKVFSNLNVPADGSYLDILSNTLNLTGEDNFLIPKLYQKSQEVDIQRIRWNIAGNTSTATNKKGKYIKIENDELIWDNDINNSYNQYILKVELNYRNPNKNNDKTKTYYAFYSLPIIIYKNKPPFTESARIAIKDSSYIKEVVYNADGRNPLYNHNQGLELINVPDNCLITWEACGGYNENENLPDFSLLLEKDSRELLKKIEDVEQKKIYILPNDDFNGATTNNYIKAIIKKDNIEIATVIAPVNMSLNTFGLASLNAWDGNSVTIDEDEGYIMAPQIGAGYKDEETNLFTGAVMGQADDYSSGKEHLYTGLLGYKDGKRSFFLDAETGDATFGYPSLESNSNKIEIYNKETKKWEEIDNYNEGEIQLRPGPENESKIGGWRLGRKSLYYTAEKDKTNIDGKEIYKYSGKIGKSYEDPYAEHHERDIDVNDQGILLSAIPPYISIKGRKITEEQNDENSQIKQGDSVEIQLDPENVASLAIFRHYIDNNNEEKREQLSGLNNKGQLVANQMIQIPVKDEEEEESTKTSLGIENFTVFNTNHTGLSLGLKKVNNFDEDTDPFFRVSLKSDQIKTDDQIYITAGRTNNNDYVRPISIHGKSINLYAFGTGSTKSITNTKIILSDNLLQGQSLNGAGFIFYDSQTTENPKESSIISNTNLKISSFNNLYTLRTGIQDIEADGNITIKHKKKSDGTNSNGVFKLQNGEAFTLTGTKGTITTENNSSTNNIIKINNGNDSELSFYRTPENYIRMYQTGLEINALQTSSGNKTTLGLNSQDKILLQSRGFNKKNAMSNPALSFEVLNNNNVSAWFGISDALPNKSGESSATTPFYFGTAQNYGNRYIQVSQWYTQSGTTKFYDGTIKTNLSINVVDNHNIQADGGNITTTGGPAYHKFKDTRLTGENKNSLTASGNNLQALIQGCLNAAAYAKAVGDAAQETANQINQRLTSFISTYNGHTHEFSASGTTSVTIYGAESANHVSARALISAGTFKSEKDSTDVNYEPFQHTYDVTDSYEWRAGGAQGAQWVSQIDKNGSDWTKGNIPWSINNQTTDTPDQQA